MNGYYQQGDVLLFPVRSIPEPARRKDRPVLAEGEVTGHFHQAVGDGVEVLTRGEEMYLRAPHGATVVHQEHRTITLPAGLYKRRIVREYDHLAEEARDIRD